MFTGAGVSCEQAFHIITINTRGHVATKEVDDSLHIQPNMFIDVKARKSPNYQTPIENLI